MAHPAPAPPDALDALSPTRQTRAAALARPAARRVAEVLAVAREPLTAQDVADALGRHHTGVRMQLAALERAGVAERRTDPPSGRGRPVCRYLLAPDPADREASGHRELVRLLMGIVRQTGLGPDEMERFGERQGWASTPPDGGIGELREAFERLGFAPREVPGRTVPDLVLGSCPFADGVEAPGGELICRLHRGLARGIARRADPELEVTDLVVEDPRRAGCRLRLETRVDPASAID
jgi:predicted ArsR family transcriptional regulator